VFQNAETFPNLTRGKALHMQTCYDGFTFFDVIPCSYNDRTRSASLLYLGKPSDDGDSSAVYEMKQNHRLDDFEPYDSILSLRKDKILNFFAEVKNFSSIHTYIPVKFEDLVHEGSLSVIRQIEDKLKIQSKCSPQNLKISSSRNSKIYSTDYLQILNEMVDWSVEFMSGYEQLLQGSNSGHSTVIVESITSINTSSVDTISYDENEVPELDEPILDLTYYNVSERNFTLDNILESIHLTWHPKTRAARFPSVDERVKIYMGNWYSPCYNSSELGVKIEFYNGSLPMSINSEAGNPFRFDSKIILDEPILLQRGKLDMCSTSGSLVANYCQDSMEILNTFRDLDGSDALIDGVRRPFIPLLLQYGDRIARSRTVPVLSKYRMRAISREALDKVQAQDSSCKYPYLDVFHRAVTPDWTWDLYYWNAQPFYQPIIWNLNRERHFGYDLKSSRSQDIPWESKKLGALWIGDMTGGPEPSLIRPDMTISDICLINHRCQFVRQHLNSSLIYARLTSSPLFQTKDAPYLFGKSVTKKDILQYKVVISLEGNDVSSGLKWNLLSNSVVMMPPTTATSWLMEEILEPWVHYIPLRQDGSDAEEMIRWVGENDLKARRIAERGALFMYDFLYHPDAKEDESLVKKEVLKRYRNFWDASTIEFHRDSQEYGIHVIGERHTGTRWLHRHLQQCFGDKIKVYDRLSRYKYWFQVDDESKDYGLVVATSRNVYDWLYAMKEKPLHAPWHYNTNENTTFSLDVFINRRWIPNYGIWTDLNLLQEDQQLLYLFKNAKLFLNITYGKRLFMEKCYDGFTFFDVIPCSYNDRMRTKTLFQIVDNDLDDGDSSAVYEMRKDHPVGDGDFVPYKSILELRRDKMINFHSEVPQFWSTQHYLPMRFEDMVEVGTESLLQEIENKMGIERSCQPAKLDVPYNGNMKDLIPPEHRALINLGVDWSAESIMGYEKELEKS